MLLVLFVLMVRRHPNGAIASRGAFTSPDVPAFDFSLQKRQNSPLRSAFFENLFPSAPKNAQNEPISTTR